MCLIYKRHFLLCNKGILYVAWVRCHILSISIISTPTDVLPTQYWMGWKAKNNILQISLWVWLWIQNIGSSANIIQTQDLEGGKGTRSLSSCMVATQGKSTEGSYTDVNIYGSWVAFSAVQCLILRIHQQLPADYTDMEASSKPKSLNFCSSIFLMALCTSNSWYEIFSWVPCWMTRCSYCFSHWEVLHNTFDGKPFMIQPLYLSMIQFLDSSSTYLIQDISHLYLILSYYILMWVGLFACLVPLTTCKIF